MKRTVNHIKNYFERNVITLGDLERTYTSTHTKHWNNLIHFIEAFLCRMCITMALMAIKKSTKKRKVSLCPFHCGKRTITLVLTLLPRTPPPR